MELATPADESKILDMYKAVVDKVNTTTVKLGWNTDVYPDETFIHNAVSNDEMCIIRENERVVAAAVVNHTVIPEYDRVGWKLRGPREKIATIHALAVAPDRQGTKLSYIFLNDIEEYLRQKGDLAVHLDVIDTNIPAYKLYIRNGYEEIDRLPMYYEVVGSRLFWMMEHIL